MKEVSLCVMTKELCHELYKGWENKECTMSIHMQNDTVKGRGYGTSAEQLAVQCPCSTGYFKCCIV